MGQLEEDFLQLRGRGPQENDVAGGPVHVGDAAAAAVPQVAEIAQVLRGVELAAGLADAHGVEMGHARELLRHVAVATDDAAAVTEDADDAAVLPVRAAVLVGELHQAENVVNHVDRNLVIDFGCSFRAMFGQLLQVRHKARPRTTFQLVQHRGFVFCHYLPPL